MRIRDRLKTLEDSAINAATTTALAGKADVTTVTALTKAVADNKVITDKTQADLTALTTTVASNKAAADAGIASAIADWYATRTYNKGNIVLRNKAMFESNVANNLNKDPATDLTGAWGPFVPGEVNSLFFNRAPTSADVYPAGVKWYDLSFGSDTPLVMISLGNGAWGYLNQITLAKIRIYGGGTGSTYRSQLNTVQFFKPDGTQIPNGWFTWGTNSGIGGGISSGLAFSGQAVTAGYNAWGYCEINCSSLFDTSITIGKINGNTPYFTCSSIEFWYSNGSKKVFSGTGGPTICTCTQPVICRYGDATSAAQGVMLTAAQLTNPNDSTYGRISPAALNSAIQAIVSPTAKTPSQADFDALVNRIAQLESRLP